MVSEELRVLAREEANVALAKVRFINVHLHKKFPDRSLESIKGQRRQLRYKVMVDEFKASLRRRSSISMVRRSLGLPTEPESVSVSEEVQFEVSRLCDVLEIQGGRAAELTSIARRVLSGEVPVGELMAWIKAMCPTAVATRGPNIRRVRAPRGNAKERRRQAYATMQELYKSDKKAVMRDVLKTGAEGVQHPGTSGSGGENRGYGKLGGIKIYLVTCHN